jgi:hypothetical protein
MAHTVVLMDLSETYRSIVVRYFDRALIVAGRFHAVRLINHHFMEAWKGIDPVGRKSRGLISLMRRHQENLRPEQVPKLRTYLADHPVLERLYDFKQELCDLVRLKKLTVRAAKRAIPDLLSFIECLKDTPIPTSTLGATGEEPLNRDDDADPAVVVTIHRRHPRVPLTRAGARESGSSCWTRTSDPAVNSGKVRDAR